MLELFSDFLISTGEYLVEIFYSLAKLAIQIVFLATLLWVISNLRWLRIATGFLLLTAWGILTIFFPIYFAWQDFSEGEIFLGILTLTVSSIIAWPFCMGLQTGWRWLLSELKHKER